MRIQKANYIMDVDVEKTNAYYKNICMCECDGCSNFYKAIKNRLPKLKEFLGELGVNVERPEELGWYADEENNSVNYYFVAYTVTGKLLEQDKYEIDIWDEGLFLNIKIDEDYIPNEQAEDYFVITVYNIVLPWVLDKPLESLVVEKKNKSSIWKKLFKF